MLLISGSVAARANGLARKGADRLYGGSIPVPSLPRATISRIFAQSPVNRSSATVDVPAAGVEYALRNAPGWRNW